MSAVTVHHVKKTIRLGKRDSIKYQLLTHCFVNDIRLSNNEIDCLSLLGILDSQNLSVFCKTAVDEGIFKTEQTVRNFINRACEAQLVAKEASVKLSRISIRLHESLQIVNAEPLLLDYRVVYAP